MKMIKIKKRYEKQYKKGYPLLTLNVLQSSMDKIEQGEIFGVTTIEGEWIGQAYYGIQNKGIGWIISTKKIAINKNFFVKKLKQAVDRRKSLYESEITTAFRVLNGEGEGLGGLTIDYYDGFYLINWYNEGIYKYNKLIIEALKSLVIVKGIYVKRRFAKMGQVVNESSYLEGEIAPNPLVVKENNIRLAVYLDDGAMIGYFLDQREVRKKIMTTYAKGLDILNTFSYTGAFSIAATLGGAKKTTSIDLANRSKSRTIEHFNINKLNTDEHSIIVDDVFNYFKYAIRKRLLFDMVILDPPSFAKSKRHTFSAEKDYTDLLKKAIAITRKHGIIIASTNCSTFNMYKFKGFVEQAFLESNIKYEILEQYTLPYDFQTIPAFKEGNYLKVLFLRKS